MKYLKSNVTKKTIWKRMRNININSRKFLSFFKSTECVVKARKFLTWQFIHEASNSVNLPPRDISFPYVITLNEDTPSRESHGSGLRT